MRVALRLPESNRRRSRRLGGTVVSVVAHAALIMAAVYGTREIADAAAEEPRPPIPIYLDRHPAPVTPAPLQPASAGESGGLPADPALPPLPAPPIVEELRLPSDLTDVALPSVGSTAEEFRRGSVLGSPMAGPVGPPGGASGIFVEHQVERAVVPLPGGAPRYPEALRAAGVEGRVRARFVVDTLGRVELASLELPDATHAQFAEAVRQALPRLRFRPAEAGGRRVRQLVEQEFGFTLRE